MKNAFIGDFLLWRKKPAKIVGECSSRQVIIETIEHKLCPHCNGDLGKEQFNVVVSSPLFQENAEKLNTIQEDESLIITD